MRANSTRRPAFLGAVVITTILAALFAATPRPAAHAASTHTWHVLVSTQSSNMAIQGMSFLPSEIWIDQGDTVMWQANAAEIHTVTFMPPGVPPPPFDESANQVNRVGGSVYDGMSYFNSGLMTSFQGIPAYRTYSLTFPSTGNFTFWCLVHAPMMKGVVHVRPAGTPYPYSQADYDTMARQMHQAIMNEGYKLAATARRNSDTLHVTVGIADSMAMYMRFFPQRIVIREGQTVTFTARALTEPHTVTFGPEEANDFAPYGDPHNFHGQPLNSGFLGIVPGWFGTIFKVTFTKAGTYQFRCDLHDYMGMYLTIVVLPKH